MNCPFFTTRFAIAQCLINSNTRLVMTEILKRGPLSRTSIARLLGVTEASVSRITRGLLDVGLVEEVGYLDGPKRPGRRRIGIQIRAAGGYVAAITVNVFRQDIVIANIANETIASKRLVLRSLESATEVLTTCVNELNQLIHEQNIDPDRIIGCGVAITGGIDPVNNFLRDAPAIGWSNVNVGELLRKNLKFPFVLESIPNAKNLAIRSFGVTRNIDNVVLFNCSLGIGCSIQIDGELLRGDKSRVGLIESLLIPDDFSKLQPLNSMAGGFGVINQSMVNSGADGYEFATKLREAIAANSPDAHINNGRTLADAGRSLGYAIMVANSFLHSQKVVISGPMIDSSLYVEAIKSAVSQYIDPEFVRHNLEFSRIRSYEAAQSLAIHHFLTERGSFTELARDLY